MRLRAGKLFDVRLEVEGQRPGRKRLVRLDLESGRDIDEHELIGIAGEGFDLENEIVGPGLDPDDGAHAGRSEIDPQPAVGIGNAAGVIGPSVLFHLGASRRRPARQIVDARLFPGEAQVGAVAADGVLDEPVLESDGGAFTGGKDEPADGDRPDADQEVAAADSAAVNASP